MTNQEKTSVINDYKAAQHVRIVQRINKAKAEREARERKAATDPEAKDALRRSYEKNIEYHRKQVALFEQKLAELS